MNSFKLIRPIAYAVLLVAMFFAVFSFSTSAIAEETPLPEAPAPLVIEDVVAPETEEVVTDTDVVDEVVEEATDAVPTEEVPAPDAPVDVVEEPTASDEVGDGSAEDLEVIEDPASVFTPESEQTDTPIETPELSTDKDDYHPGETATIFGRFFAPVTSFMIKIFGSDDNNENYTETEEVVETDEEGSFSFSYVLDSLYRPFYEVVVSAVETGEKIAETWFRDSGITYDQCSNDDGDGYSSGGKSGCDWVNGSLQSSNSTYFEGDSTVQRLVLQGYVPGSTHTVTFKYGTTKGGHHAYDYLTTWDASENWITAADRCEGVTGCLTASEMQFAMKNDTNVPDSIEPDVATRKFTIRGGTITDVSVPSIISGTYAGDSETLVTVTFTTANSGAMCDTKSNVTSCGIALWFGAHVAKTTEWSAYNQTTGAGSIQGAPYHVALDSEDGTSIGQRDNQMQSNALPSAITIRKQTTPDGSVTQFPFAVIGTNYTNFSLADDGVNTQVLVPKNNQRTYTVTEGLVTDWSLTDIQCSSTNILSTVTKDVANRKVTIVLDLGASTVVDCTFTNTEEIPAPEATLTLVKNLITDNGGTANATDWTLTADNGDAIISGVTGSPTVTSASVLPGIFTLGENGGPVGYSASEYSCVINGGAPVVGNQVTIADGDVAVCTITNNDIAPQLTVIKHVINDNGGLLEADDFTMNVTATNPSDASFPGSEAPGTTITLDAGNYSVDENAVLGYTKSLGANCSGTIAVGESKTCTITNDDQPATLIVKKIVDNGNTGATTNPTAFSYKVNGGSDVVFELDGQNDATVSAGTYTIVENPTAGYTTTYDNCSNLNIPNGGTATCTITNTAIAPTLTLVKHVVVDDGGTATAANFQGKIDGNNVPWGIAQAVTVGAHTASETTLPGYTPSAWSNACAGNGTVSLALGENKTCEITNDDQQAFITVTKVVTNNSGGNAAPNDFLLTLGGAPVTSGVAVPVNPGTYTAGETLLSGYSFEGFTGDCNAETGDITVALGESKTCTLTNNDQQSYVIVDKTVVNDNGGNAGPNDFLLTVDGNATTDGVLVPVNPGAHTAGETTLPGYTAGVWGGDCAVNGSVNVPLGTTKTCTITNNDVAPILHLRKVVTSDDGGTATLASFTLTANGTGANDISGTSPVDSGSGLLADTFALSETNVAGYTASAWSCVGGTQNGSNITVGIGQEATCTITNDDQPGTLVVHKVTDPASDTTTQFSITASADSGLVEGTALQTIAGGETESYTVHKGVYDVTEAPLAGWDMTGNDCVNVAVGNGETKHCTITNTKKGHLIVQKTTLPALDATIFSINASGNGTITGGGAGVVTDIADKDYEVTPGTYSVSETVPAGWDKTGDTCQNIEVSAGETETCVITNTKRGHIIIEKNAIPDGGQVFTFNNNFGNGNPATFNLTDTAAAGIPSYNAEVLPGKYSVTEDAVTGWQLDGVSCNAGETINDIDVAPGETVTCTFINEKLAKITLVKNTVGGNGDFDFDATGAGLPADIDLTTVEGTASVVFENLNPDNEYSIAETVPTGWTLISSVCSNNDPVNDISPNAGEEITCTFTNGKLPTLTLDKTVVNDNGGTKVETDFQGKIDGVNQAWDAAKTLTPGVFTASETTQTGYQASAWGGACAENGSVTLAYGDVKTCTITNDDVAPQLTVIKHVINDNGGTLEADDFTMNVTATEPSDDSFGGAEAPGTTITLDAGNYSVDETGVAGYAKTLGANCSGTIAIGESKTCTITNDDIAPKLHLRKMVVNDNGGSATTADFTLTADGTASNDLSGVSPVDGGAGLQADTWALSETQLSGYTASDWVCVGGSQNGSNITVGIGQEATCTITNDDEQAYITVTKVVTNDNGGSAQPDDFALKLEGNAVLSGIAVPVNPGTYTASETLLSGYTFEGFTGACDSNGDVTVALGESKTCTLTNNDQQAYITVTKVVNNNYGGSAIPNDFALKLEGNAVLSGVAMPVNPGTYTAEETLLAGYSFNGFSGECNENGDTTVALGQSKTCTLTNSDIAPQLTVIKHVINDNGGTLEADDFTMNVTAAEPSDDSFGGAEAPGTTITLDAGEYSVDESTNADYSKSIGANCSGTIAIGETRTCTITNNDIAPVLHLRKIVTNDNGGNATLADFTLTANGTDANDISGTSPVDSGVTLKADTFALSESAVAGYSASEWVCEGGVQDDATITLGLGDEATCTITNDDIAPKLTLNKIVVNDNGGTEAESAWDLTATGPTTITGPGTDGDADVVSEATFDAGAYVLSESAGPSDYTASAWSCTNGDNDGSILIGLGEDVICTITNNDDAPTLTLNKVVVNDDGGTVKEDDFTLTATGPTGFSGAGPQVVNGASFDAGEYLLSESNISTYEASAWSCALNGGLATEGASVTLGLGDDAVCTITNDDIAPTIEIIKETVGGEGTFEFIVENLDTLTLKDLSISLTTVSGTKSSGEMDIVAGTHTVTETAQTGWDLTGSFCSIDGGANTGITGLVIGLAQKVVCTFENTKRGTITVTKRTDPVNDPTMFSFDANGGVSDSLYTDFSISGKGGQNKNTQTLRPGTYSVTELASGWKLRDLTCTADSGSSVTVDGATANITLGAGGNVNCTFFNASPRMTGGGSVFPVASSTLLGIKAGTRVTHGFELHCTPGALPNNLQINWAGTGKGKAAENNFHLDTLTAATCIDNPEYDPEKPDSVFDTHIGAGTGSLNNKKGYRAEWVLTDHGEPGKYDTFALTIKDPTGATVLYNFGTTVINMGNHQAH